MHLLRSGIVDEDIDHAHRLEGLLGDRLTVRGRAEIHGQEMKFATFLLNLLLGLLGVRLLLLEVNDHALGSLHREQDCNGAADTGVASGDERLLALELAGGLVGLTAALTVGNLVARRLRLHLALETRCVFILDGSLMTYDYC